MFSHVIYHNISDLKYFMIGALSKGSVVGKLVTDAPARCTSPLSIWWTSTFRLQPCRIVSRKYHSRSVGSFILSMRAMWWYQVICAKQLLHNWPVRPDPGKFPHIFEVPDGESFHCGKLTHHAYRMQFPTIRSDANSRVLFKRCQLLISQREIINWLFWKWHYNIIWLKAV